jgi:biopolymer transport protein ExbD
VGMGSLSDHDEDEFNPEINTTPLVDVMLVLLIIFMVTIPVIHHSVQIDLPKASSAPQTVKPESIDLSIDAAGQGYWNTVLMNDANLNVHMQQAAKQEPKPELHLHADQNTPYRRIAEVMSMAQSSGLEKMAFVTVPVKK